ncbi:hypothetical protein [Nocardia sp. NBC_00403]|uniref:hypothetical protein n=1 Tax=Nocardia sp. NBC_00403 TaxID=2975990 RepID=UPI002E236D8B
MVLVVVVALAAGTKLAKDHGQGADWYTGVGQWVGGLGSLIAAGIALWIATSDRRRADRLRSEEQERQAADLAREAGLVMIDARRLASVVRIAPGDSKAGVSVRNRRRSRLFDIEIVRFVQQGEEVADLELQRQFGVFDPAANEGKNRTRSDLIDLLPVLVLNSDQVLTLFPKNRPDVPADYVAVRYTDESGMRWEVDTDGSPARKVG